MRGFFSQRIYYVFWKKKNFFFNCFFFSICFCFFGKNSSKIFEKKNPYGEKKTCDLKATIYLEFGVDLTIQKLGGIPKAPSMPLNLPLTKSRCDIKKSFACSLNCSNDFFVLSMDSSFGISSSLKRKTKKSFRNY